MKQKYLTSKKQRTTIKKDVGHPSIFIDCYGWEYVKFLEMLSSFNVLNSTIVHYGIERSVRFQLHLDFDGGHTVKFFFLTKMNLDSFIDFVSTDIGEIDIENSNIVEVTE